MSDYGICNDAILRPSYVPRITPFLETAPNWSGTAVVKSQLQDISSKDYVGKYVVLLFYPYDFTFICPSELIQFSERMCEFHKIGAEIVGISTDSPYSHVAWITTPRKQGGLGDMNFPILSDNSHRISKDFGVLDEPTGIAYRALFIIDDKQIIRHVTINDTTIPRSVDEVLRVIHSCQFVDRYGDICTKGPKVPLIESERNSCAFFDST